MIPGITVLIPAYNSMPYLRSCIESVLSQSYRNIEVLVINDGSTDGTADYLDSIQDSRLRIIHQENQGFVASLNKGLAEARYDWVARLDSDDVMRNDRIQQQVQFLEDHPEVRAVSCNYRFINANDKVTRFVRHTKLHHPPFFNPSTDENLLHVGMLYNRHDVLAAGAYRNLIPAEDLDLWLRMSQTVKFAVIADDLTYVRILESGLTTGNFMQQRMMWRYVKFCAKCRSNQQPEPHLDQWLKENEAIHSKKRMEWKSGYHYRLAGLSFMNSSPIQCAWHLLLAAICSPSTFASKLSGYIRPKS